MNSIRVVSGADKTYKQFYLKLKQDCEKFGYAFTGYDYGGLGEGTKFNPRLKNPTDYKKYVGKIPGKPEMILDALNKYKEFLVYLDCDVRIRQPIDEVVDVYDVGITAHDPSFHDAILYADQYPHITGYLNAGVIFFNNTDKTKHFVKEWIKDVKFSTTGSDQEALTNLLRRSIDDWSLVHHVSEGAMIRLFPSSIYNYTGIRGECDDPKLVHYTGTVQDKIRNGILID